MPFCSDRCRMIDLGAWASEKYVISEPLPDIDDNEGVAEPDGD
ncbi:MAG: DNA gyrase inhibitor YacG [Bryobacteraceae bacterium]